MSHVYGKSIAHKVRVFAGETPVAVHSLVSARLYPAVPTPEQRADEAAALGGFVGEAKTVWSATDLPNLVYTVTFDAVDDDEPESARLYDVWHPVVNVRLEAGKQVHAQYKPIVVWRPVPQFSQMDVEPDDVYEIEGEIEAVLGDGETLKKIHRAKTRVLNRIKSKGLDRTRLQEIDLSEAVTYLAASMSLRDMATEQNDYYRKAMDLRDEYEAIWDALKPGYDQDGDGVIDPDEKVSTMFPVFLMR